MGTERLRDPQDLLDLTFQSLASRHMDLKQVELDSAVAKVDELSRQLESLWTEGPGPPKEPTPNRTFSPVGHRSSTLEAPEMSGEPAGRPTSPRPPLFLAGEDRAPSPRPKVLAVPYEGAGGRAPASPRPPRHHEMLVFAGSPRASDGGVFFGEREAAPRLPAPPPYEIHGFYPSLGATGFRAQDDLVLKRRSQKSWNESDLDVAYEKKPPGSGGTNRVSEGRALSPWRESSLDGAGALGKDGCRGGHSSTLPRNYKVSPLSGERQGGGGSLRPPPRSWPPPPPQHLVSRIPVPPPAATPPAPPRHKPLPLSVIFKLQNAFWEQGGGVGGGNNPWGLLLGPPHQLQPPPQPQPPPQAGPRAPLKQLQLEGEGSPRPPPLSVSPPEPDPFLLLPAVPPFPEDSEEASRPLSPTRLQPLPPPEARAHPALGELLRVLAEVPRPLKRRGSQELRPTPRTRLYRHLIPRLLHPPAPAAAPPDAADAEPAAQSPGTAARGSPEAHAELRSALRDPSCPRRRPGGRVRLNPLVLLLDAALTGELDVVQQAVAELNDPSQPNAEGITALHNGICGANRPVVDFLIACGANVNAPDSHGWTPLHCAASCNDTGVCVALVRHGAAVFATTSSDGSVASEKCDPYREGYSECYSYLCEVEQGMGVLNSGVVYALWDFSAELQDELSFREGDAVTVLRRQPLDEHDWWWGSLYGHEGYVPRNYFGLFPRVRPQRKKT